MTLRDWAARTCPRYGEIRAPVVIVAGTDDKAVDYRGLPCACITTSRAQGCTFGRIPATWCITAAPKRLSSRSRRFSRWRTTARPGQAQVPASPSRPPRQRRPSSPPREAVPSRPCPGGEVVFRLLTEHRLQIAAGLAIQPREKRSARTDLAFLSVSPSTNALGRAAPRAQRRSRIVPAPGTHLNKAFFMPGEEHFAHDGS